MKGIVFTEFLDMVENNFGVTVLDRILTRSVLPSGGIYTAVGTYSHTELLALVTQLSEATDRPVPSLVRAYGEYLFQRFAVLYPQLFAGVDDAFGFIERIDGYIHVEVRKLYPDAELPRFLARRVGDDELELTYESPRPFADLAEGLIQGCFDHFHSEVEIERQCDAGHRAQSVVFRLRRRNLKAA